ncbi:conjugal transfer protein [Nocardia sp. NPDC003693]
MGGPEPDSGEQLLRRMAARRRRDKIVVVVFALLAVLGGGHAVVDAFSTPPPGPSENSTLTLTGRARLAESFAREFVVLYLSAAAGQQDRISEFVGGAQQAGLPSAGRAVSDPSVVYTTRTLSSGSADVWAVTVSVRVAKRTGIAENPRQYYRVAVSVIDGRLRALSLPAAVEPPGRGADLALAYGTPCAADTPLAQVAAGFLRAMLTGSGEIGRYTTPDSGIAALHPTPFSAAEVTTVSAEDPECGANSADARVLANIEPKADGATTPTLSYPLSMVRVAGQWQVRSVDPVPALRIPLTVAVGDDRTGGADTQGSPNSPPRSATTTVAIPPATQN